MRIFLFAATAAIACASAAGIPHCYYCPDSYTLLPGTDEIWISQLKKATTYTYAQTTCATEGALLPVLYNSTLFTAFNQWRANETYPLTYNMWIGLTYESPKPDQTWVWAAQNYNFLYNNLGQPVQEPVYLDLNSTENKFATGQGSDQRWPNCARIGYYDNGAPFNFANADNYTDVDCNGLYPFICMINASVTINPKVPDQLYPLPPMPPSTLLPLGNTGLYVGPVQSPTSFPAANISCNASGGYLPILDTPAKYDAFVAWRAKSGYNNLWLGLNYQSPAVNKTWIWSSGKVMVMNDTTINHFSATEGKDNRFPNCVQTTGVSWADVSCTQTPNVNFVCFYNLTFLQNSAVPPYYGQTEGCPDNFVPLPNTGRCISFLQPAATAKQANETCLAMGGYLPILDTSLVANTFNLWRSTLSYADTYNLWLGLNYSNPVNKNFYWSSDVILDRSDLTVNRFIANPPNVTQGTNRWPNCVRTGPATSGYANPDNWIDVSCAETHPFVCMAQNHNDYYPCVADSQKRNCYQVPFNTEFVNSICHVPYGGWTGMSGLQPADTYSNAQQKCHSQNAYLPVLDTKDKFDKFNQLRAQHGPSWYRMWIGLKTATNDPTNFEWTKDSAVPYNTQTSVMRVNNFYYPLSNKTDKCAAAGVIDIYTNIATSNMTSFFQNSWQEANCDEKLPFFCLAEAFCNFYSIGNHCCDQNKQKITSDGTNPTCYDCAPQFCYSHSCWCPDIGTDPNVRAEYGC